MLDRLKNLLNLFGRSPYYILLLNHLEKFGPEKLAYGPFASCEKAWETAREWDENFEQPLGWIEIQRVEEECGVPDGYIKSPYLIEQSST